MPQWSNWSGRLTSKPTALKFLRSEQDAQALALDAAERGDHVRVAGATHSHAPLVRHDGIVAVCDGLAGVLEVNTTDRTAWVGAGTRIYALGQALNRHGLALANQGDIDEQAIAGATGTGTHGTGSTLTNLSARVISARIALADGSLVETDASKDPDLWQAARLHLGSLGIVTALKLQLVDACVLKEHGWQAPLDELLDGIEARIEGHRHFEFFWYPQQDRGQAKAIDPTDAPPQYPLADEGQRQAWSHEVLPNYRPHKHTEMEYSVPREAGAACMRDIQKLLRDKHVDVAWPVEYRTVAPDDVWLSSAYARPTVTISVHQDVALDETEYYEDCEAIFRAYDGRPHWGKVNYLDGETLADIHPRWYDWWTVRDRVDPSQTFLNDYMRSIRPA